MNRMALFEEIRRGNRPHLPALLAALGRIDAGIHLTRADQDALIDGLEEGNASLAFDGPDRAKRALAARIPGAVQTDPQSWGTA